MIAICKVFDPDKLQDVRIGGVIQESFVASGRSLVVNAAIRLDSVLRLERLEFRYGQVALGEPMRRRLLAALVPEQLGSGSAHVFGLLGLCSLESGSGGLCRKSARVSLAEREDVGRWTVDRRCWTGLCESGGLV